jgi:hypothetical protein
LARKNTRPLTVRGDKLARFDMPTDTVKVLEGLKG